MSFYSLLGFNPKKQSRRTEMMAGVTTFLTMSYILAVNPDILSAAGMDKGAVFTATALASALGTLFIAFLAKLPFAQAPGMGINAFFAFTLVKGMGYSWEAALAAVFVEGIIFIILTALNIREQIVKCIPKNLRFAISGGLGLFIAFIGLVDSGIIRRMPDAAGTTVPVSLGVGGHLLGWPTLVFIFGLFLTIALFIRNVRGAILIGVVASTVLAIILEAVFHIGSSKGNPTGWSLNVPALNNFSFSAPDFSLIGSARFGAFGAIGVLGASLLVFAILLSVFFDAMGVSVGLATEAGTIDKDGKVENINEVLLVDAVGSVVGGGASGSANQIFVESATGIGEGARTGLANIVTGVLFLVAIIASPLVTIVPFEAVAPALVVVGFLMVRQAVHIDWQDWGLGIPAFMTIIFMPLSYSIANGIGAGFVSYAFIRLVQGRGREVHWLMYVVSAVFVIYFGMGIINGFTH